MCAKQIICYYSLVLHGLEKTFRRQYIPIFFVVWALVVYLAIIRVSADSRSNPLVIPQIGKNALISSPLWRQREHVMRGLFRRFGYRLTSIFSEESRKSNFINFRDT